MNYVEKTGNIEIEKILLGSILQDRNLINIIKSYDDKIFQYENHKKLYKLILDLHSKNIEDIYLTICHMQPNFLTLTELTEIYDCSSKSQFDGALTIAKQELNKLNILELKNNISTKDTMESIIEKVDNFKNKDKTVDFEPTSNILDDLLTEIEDIYSSGKNKYISTGFEELDIKLGGGLYSGLYVIGAGSSIGKTTFAQQIADTIADNNKNVLFFSLEMGKKEMLAKTIVRESFKNRNWTVGTRELLNANLKESDFNTLCNNINSIKNIINNLFYVEGNFGTTIKDIVNKAKLFKAKYKESPVVVVDYLQIISPTDIRMGDKQNVDMNIAELKRLSRDLDTPVIVISSVNRQNYLSYIDFSSFKESGSIEYGADVVIGLQLTAIHTITKMKDSQMNEKRDIYNKAKAEIPRKIELVVLKNRNGTPTSSHWYEYNAKFNLFRELKEDNKINNEIAITKDLFK